MAETQFSIKELEALLGSPLDSIWDENDGDSEVLTLATGRDNVSGFLELHVEDTDEGVYTRWKWIVNEPKQEACFTDVCDTLEEAARELNRSMDEMLEYIRERDGETDQDES